MIDMKAHRNGVADIHKAGPVSIQNLDSQRNDGNRVSFEPNKESVALNFKRNYSESDLLEEKCHDCGTSTEERALSSDDGAFDTIDRVPNDGKRSSSSAIKIFHHSKGCSHLMVPLPDASLHMP